MIWLSRRGIDDDREVVVYWLCRVDRMADYDFGILNVVAMTLERDLTVMCIVLVREVALLKWCGRGGR